MTEQQNTVSFWYQMYQKIGPAYIFRTAVFTFLLFANTVIFSLISPQIGEAFAYNFTLMTGAMYIGFIGLLTAAGIGVGVFFSSLIMAWGYKHLKKEVARANGNDTLLLPSGLNGDILYIEDLHQTHDANLSRLEAYKQALAGGCYLGLLAFRQPYIAFFEGGTGDQWAVERGDIDTVSGLDYSTESAQDFARYAQGFQSRFAAYCAKRKIEIGGKGAFDAVTASSYGRAAMAVFALLMLALPAYAQNNTARIMNALGAASSIKPPDGAKVTYTFEKGSATRTADGNTTVSELYTKGFAGAESAAKGDFIGVDIGGLAITAKAVNKRTDNDQPEKEKPLLAAAKNASEALPDSVTTKEKISAWERMTRAKGAEFWSAFGDFVTSDLFNWLVNILLIMLLVFRFWANFAVGEGRISAYGNTVYGAWALKASNVLRFVAWCLIVVVSAPPLMLFAWYFLECEFLNALGIFFNLKMLMFVILVLIFTFFERVGDWLLKNPVVQRATGGGHEKGGRGNYPANFNG